MLTSKTIDKKILEVSRRPQQILLDGWNIVSISQSRGEEAIHSMQNQEKKL